MLQSERDAVLKATFRAPFNVRGCAYVRVLSFKDGSVIVIRLPPKWFCYPFFCRRFESKTRVGYGMMVARSRKSIDFFLLLPSPPSFFFLKVKLKVFTAD